MDELRVSDTLVIPPGELMWRFGPSGGPGGQHANRSNTRAELGFDVARSPSLPDELRARVLDGLSGRLADGELWVVADESRSQWRNRNAARRKMAQLLAGAMRPAPAARRETKPTRAAKRRRIESKRRRSELKRNRKPPDLDE